MNRTLLLILCDFLLLNLLALTRSDKGQQEAPKDPPAALTPAGKGSNAQEDLVESLRDALTEERIQRDALKRRLNSEVTARDQSLAQAEEKRRQLETDLTQTRQSAAQLDAQLVEKNRLATQVRQELEQAKVRLDETVKSREALAENAKVVAAEKQKLQEQLETQRQQASSLAAARADAEQKLASLNSAMKVAEAEKKLLRENMADLRNQISRSQEEKNKLQEQTSALAQGVNQLAKTSDQFREEVRQNTPLNANQLYSDFLTNRVQVNLSGQGQALFGSSTKEKETATVLVTDGAVTMALIHVNEAPFTLSIPAFGVDYLTTRIRHQARPLDATSPFLLAIDPSVVGIPLDPAPVQSMKIKVYPLAKNPFKFPEAVLVSRGGRYYGEVEFQLNPKTPAYVRMKTRLISRIFGEFSPSVGDLVLSKSGEILGVMVNSEYCVVLKSLQPAAGGVLDSRMQRDEMSRKLEVLRGQVNSLPLSLQ